MEDEDDIMDHPLFQDAVPSDLSQAHTAYRALAHLSSSSSGENDDEPKRPQRVKKTIAKPKRKPKSSAIDKKMKEMEFVTRNWKPLR